MKKDYAFAAVLLVICLCVSLFYVSFILNFSTGSSPGPGPGGGDLFECYNVPEGITNQTAVDISLGYVPARGILLFSTYTVTNSNHRIIAHSTLLHFPLTTEYFIDKDLTSLPNGNYTFKITDFYANGVVRTAFNEAFTVNTAFKYPVLTVTSPKSQTYNSTQVNVTYHINSKVVYSYYKLDDADWTWFHGNITLSGLSNGPHELAVSVVTVANQQLSQADEEQTIYFNINSPTSQ